MEEIDMFLLDPSNGDLLQFPVNPPKIDVHGEAMQETVEIARIGEVDWHIGNKRTQISWQSFFPGHYDPQYCRFFLVPDPLAAGGQVDAWRVAGTILRLIITGLHNGARKDIINAPVLISSFVRTFQGGEPDDLYFDIGFRQYRQVQIRTAAEGGSFVPPRLDLVPVAVGDQSLSSADGGPAPAPATEETPRFFVQHKAGVLHVLLDTDGPKPGA